eukprot:TRINITY_DN4587_c0_g1_i2.p1 TRINITY_DN4587_c0_g1~~TRINITY_DN4587_c0_g1_i2.p1  ORF type:complete len:126 (+),score=25.75 TRINITY_DN4587_c0_g1_i2:154-531(+)
MISGELQTVLSFPNLFEPYFWFVMTLSGVFGVAIAIVTMMQIKYTSPLTHNISGTSKACFQTILAVSVNDETKSGLWWLGNFLVLGGSAFYSHVRTTEMRALHLLQQQQQMEHQKHQLDSKSASP